MGLFDFFRRRKDEGPALSRNASSRDVTELKEFARSRDGVEGFLEPATNVYGLTLLLVAGDGEYLRRPLKNAKQAEKLCADAGIPLYEARKVGYPQRMKDFERGIRRQSVSLEDLPPLDVIDRPEDV